MVSNQCPPVSYTTRLHMLIFQTYIFSVSALIINYYLWCIEFAKKELGIANNKKKTLLADSQALAKRLKSFNLNDDAAKDRAAAQKIIVLAEGIHKQDPAPAPATEPAKLTGTDGVWGLSDDLAECNVQDKGGKQGCAAAAKEEAAAAPVGSGGRVAPEPIAACKTEEDGAFKNEEGVFHDVLELLESGEVRREGVLVGVVCDHTRAL